MSYQRSAGARCRCAKSFALLMVSLAACGPSELRHVEEDAPTDRGDGATSPRDAAGARSDAGEDTAFDPEWSVVHQVAVLNFAPRIEGSPLFEWAGWNDPSAQASDYASSMHAASHGAITYEIVDWLDLDAFPIKADGFAYDAGTYRDCLEDSSTCHSPDLVDYLRIIDEYQLCERVVSGQLDEVWMFGGPYFGYYESTMVGAGAFRVNSPPVLHPCEKPFIIMGFNYERAVAQMLHNFGHRLESILEYVFQDAPEPSPYALFRRHDGANPGDSRCGDTHFPPNAESDYDYANPRTVSTRCHAYEQYPDVSSPPREIDCSAWGCDERGRMMYMFASVPRNRGTTDGYFHNWWRYLVGFDEFVELDTSACGERGDIDACNDAGGRCSWYLCVDECIDTGTPVEWVCNDCWPQPTLEACNDTSSCAWYACVERCLPQGTPIDDVCG